MYGGSPYDKHHQGNVKRGLFVWMPLLIAGTVGLFFIHPWIGIVGFFPLWILVMLGEEKTEKPSRKMSRLMDDYSKHLDHHKAEFKKKQDKLDEERQSSLNDCRRSLVLVKKAEKMFGKAKA